MFIATILAGLRTANNVSSKGIALISVAAVVTVAYKCNFFKAHVVHNKRTCMDICCRNRLKGMELVRHWKVKPCRPVENMDAKLARLSPGRLSSAKDEDASAEGESGITDKPHEYTELKSEEFLRNSLTVRKKVPFQVIHRGVRVSRDYPPDIQTFIVNAALAALFGFQTAQTLDDLILETKSKAVRTPPPKPIKSLPPLTKAYSTTITYGSFPNDSIMLGSKTDHYIHPLISSTHNTVSAATYADKLTSIVGKKDGELGRRLSCCGWEEMTRLDASLSGVYESVFTCSY